jgi:hypothetical protein
MCVLTSEVGDDSSRTRAARRHQAQVREQSLKLKLPASVQDIRHREERIRQLSTARRFVNQVELMSRA